LLGPAADARLRANFWTMLDLSTGHLRKGDCDLLKGADSVPTANGTAIPNSPFT
jgi:hypothetical protein